MTDDELHCNPSRTFVADETHVVAGSLVKQAIKYITRKDVVSLDYLFDQYVERYNVQGQQVADYSAHIDLKKRVVTFNIYYEHLFPRDEEE